MQICCTSNESMELLKNIMTEGINYKDTPTRSCIHCIQENRRRKVFQKVCYSSAGIGSHLYMWPIYEPSLGGFKYILMFTDDFLRRTPGCFLKIRIRNICKI